MAHNYEGKILGMQYYALKWHVDLWPSIWLSICGDKMVVGETGLCNEIANDIWDPVWGVVFKSMFLPIRN
ncbi:hypothetical protein TNCV_1325531 [Trichonephila clavipes]|nr:hypothetical protein TNCV_1325531 [Trichonephila clavipes]